MKPRAVICCTTPQEKFIENYDLDCKLNELDNKTEELIVKLRKENTNNKYSIVEIQQ